MSACQWEEPGGSPPNRNRLVPEWNISNRLPGTVRRQKRPDADETVIRCRYGTVLIEVLMSEFARMRPWIIALCVVCVVSGVSAQTSVWQPSSGRTQVPIWPGDVPDIYVDKGSRSPR